MTAFGTACVCFRKQQCIPDSCSNNASESQSLREDRNNLCHPLMLCLYSYLEISTWIFTSAAVRMAAVAICTPPMLHTLHILRDRDRRAL